MNNTQNGHLKRALKVAELSTCHMRHGVVIASGNRILAVAVNTQRNHPDICTEPTKEAAYHAERNALKQLEGRDIGRAVLYSARIGRSGSPLLAKPCANCEELIRASGIKKVYYTT